MATLAVVGRSVLFRAGLVSLLNMMGFDQVDEGVDIEELKQLRTGDACPEIFLINLSRGAEDIAHAMEEVRAWVPEARVIFLASDLDLDLLSGCFAAGASGFLLENISRDAFQESLKLVCAGEKVFPSSLASLIPGLTAKHDVPNTSMAELRESHLSEREIDILRCLTNGQSNKVIANKLNIAESTVKVHVKRILQKTHAANRTQAALWGAARGLSTSPPLTPNHVER